MKAVADVGSTRVVGTVIKENALTTLMKIEPESLIKVIRSYFMENGISVVGFYRDLAAMGVGPEALARLHAPIGLPIGAVTVPEIAVSIVAQLIEVRRRRPPTHVEGPFDLERDGSLP